MMRIIHNYRNTAEIIDEVAFSSIYSVNQDRQKIRPFPFKEEKYMVVGSSIETIRVKQK